MDTHPNTPSDLSSLLVAKRRVIVLYYVMNHVRADKEIPAENAVAIARYGDYMCFADSKQYFIASVRRRRILELPETDPNAKTSGGGVSLPIVKVVAPKEFLVVIASGSGDSHGAMGLFFDHKASPVYGTILWESYPKAVGMSLSFFLSFSCCGRVNT